MKKTVLLSSLFIASLFGSQSLKAQGVAVNTSGLAANNSAMLDVNSTTQGMLIPRMTNAQMTAIASPATGLMVYQTDGTAGFYYNSGTPASPAWTFVINSSSNVTTQGNSFNGNSQLVQTTSTGKLPAIDGSLLTNLPSSGGGAHVPVVTFASTSVSGSYSYTVTDATIANFYFNYGGATASGSVPTITLLPASSYAAGSVITFIPVGYITAAPASVTLTSSATGTQTYIGAFNSYNINISSGHTTTLAGTTIFKLMSDGVNTWYRVSL